MKLFLKIALIIGMFMALLLTIPDLFLPIADMIDTVFGTTMMTFMNNFYDIIPDRLMDLIALSLGALSITIIVSWLNGGIQ